MCEEKLHFWNACKDFREDRDDMRRTKKGIKIYRDYLEEGGGMVSQETYNASFPSFLPSGSFFALQLTTVLILRNPP